MERAPEQQLLEPGFGTRPAPKVLFLVDDRHLQELVHISFAKHGLGCTFASELQQVNELLLRDSFDVVLTDARVAGVAAIEVLQAVRSKIPDQPLVVVSGMRKVDEIVKLVREGASALVRKPLNPEELLDTVHRVTKAARLKDPELISYHSIVSERTEFSFTSSELSQINFELPILKRLQYAGKYNLNQKLKLELAFQEALTNSLEHGNLGLESTWKDVVDARGLDKYLEHKRSRLADPKRANLKIRVSSEFVENLLTITIDDEGKGFLEEIQSTNCLQLKNHGRGLTIIRSVMDEVCFENRGTRIVMKKKFA